MRHSIIASLISLLSICGRQADAITIPYKAPSPEVYAGEGLTPSGAHPFASVTAPANGYALDRTGWVVTADSWQYYDWAANVVDGDTNSFWHTEYTPAVGNLPHWILIDMGVQRNVAGITYLPRQDGSSNGNIGQHQIFVGNDPNNFGNPVAFGTWFDDASQKSSSFETAPGRYLKLVALSEAGNRGQWSSCAELNIYDAGGYNPPANGLGRWGATIDFPTVPVAVALEPFTGKIVAWSSYASTTFVGNPNGGQTLTSYYDPHTQTVSDRFVTNTGHDMFCPGISLDVNGRVIVTGGNSAYKTSIYDPAHDSWNSVSDMNIARGYQASVTCSDGRIFTIGGSWSGGSGGKDGEIYDPNTNRWTRLPNCPVAPMLTNDAAGVYRSDNHAWLFGWKNQYVFQAGPSKAMNWYDTKGNGGQTGVGNRDNDNDAMCGMAVMYDAVNGKILTLGGAPSYSNDYATTNAHIITLGNPGTTPSVWHFSGMYSARIFGNAVALPDGKVFITGGQTYGVPFSDDNAILIPEIWDPNTWGFYQMAHNSIPRTYHSVALLQLDGTVFTGGGGLCGDCSTNHFDGQIYYPPYLFNGDGSWAGRPYLAWVAPSVAHAGWQLTFWSSAKPASVSLIRYGSATHTVDTDQRRVPLNANGNGQANQYTVNLPNDYGILIPGYWMVFVVDGNGVPSVAQTIQIV